MLIWEFLGVPTVKHDQQLTFEICKKWEVKCPDIVELDSYEPRSQFVRQGLPCLYKNHLDLRFLTGDLDEQDKDSEVVKDILRNEFLKVGVLVGVSGCGKV